MGGRGEVVVDRGARLQTAGKLTGNSGKPTARLGLQGTYRGPLRPCKDCGPGPEENQLSPFKTAVTEKKKGRQKKRETSWGKKRGL